MKAKASTSTKKARLPAKLLLKRVKALKEQTAAEKITDNPEPQTDLQSQHDELDDIFNQIKTAKKVKAEKAAKDKSQNANKPQKRRFTTDGLPIYSENELKMDNPNAGKTPLCPFDCDCCF